MAAMTSRENQGANQDTDSINDTNDNGDDIDDNDNSR
jgi:hypothetical protein